MSIVFIVFFQTRDDSIGYIVKDSFTCRDQLFVFDIKNTSDAISIISSFETSSGTFKINKKDSVRFLVYRSNLSSQTSVDKRECLLNR